jgi:predicted small secreted protein
MPTVSTKILIALSAALFLASCANTVRGVGKDMSNTAHATQHAVKKAAS